MPKGYAGLAEVIGRHLDVHAVADADADEVLAHFAGDMGEDFMAVGQSHPEHGPRQYLGHGANQFNWFFFSQAMQYFCFWSLPRPFEGTIHARCWPQLNFMGGNIAFFGG